MFLISSLASWHSTGQEYVFVIMFQLNGLYILKHKYQGLKMSLIHFLCWISFCISVITTRSVTVFYILTFIGKS